VAGVTISADVLPVMRFGKPREVTVVVLFLAGPGQLRHGC